MSVLSGRGDVIQMNGYFSVNEFSKVSGVEASTLRYWDSIGLFSPVKRDPENNYRYYSLAQITTLNFVATCRDIGIPLETIAELRKKRDPESFLKLLERKERELDMELRKLQERSSVIHTKQVFIRHGLNVDETKISVERRGDNWPAILWPRNEYKEGDTFLEPLTSFINQSHVFRISLSFPIGGRYDDMESFLESPQKPDNFFSLDPTGANTRKPGDYLIGYARGYYGELGDLPERMVQFALENGLKTEGHVYLTYPLDEACNDETDQYLGQVMVAVKKQKRRG